MDVDQGVPVPARVEQLQSQLERVSTIALGNHSGARGQHRYERRLELPTEGARTTVWGVDEDEIVLTTVFPCSLEIPQRRRPDHLSLDSQRLQVAPDGSD